MDSERLEVLAESSSTELKTCLNRIAPFHVSAKISRSGMTFIEVDSSLMKHRDAYQLCSIERALIDLSAQSFYFLKDIGHRHQHHNERTDTVTDLHRVSGNPNDDLKWREETLFNMYRKVIDFKRHPENLNFTDCLGLLAYAEAFGKISECELSVSMPNAKLPTYYYEQVRMSILATQSKKEREVEELQAAEDKRLNILVTFFGLAIAYIGLMQFSDITKVTPSPWLIVALNFLLLHPAFCVFMLIISVFTNKILGLLPIPLDKREKFLRSFYPFSKIWPTAALLLLGIAGCCLIEYLFFGVRFGVPLF